LLRALSQAAANFPSHLVSFTPSAAVPRFCAAANRFSLQLTFLATAFVTPASQLDCACAVPASASDSTTTPRTTNATGM